MASQTKNGIVGLGFIKNIKTFISELQILLAGTSQTADQSTLDKAVDEQIKNNTIQY